MGRRGWMWLAWGLGLHGLVGCGSLPAPLPDPEEDAGWPAAGGVDSGVTPTPSPDAGGTADAGARLPPDAGADAGVDAGAYVAPARVACEYRFFKKYFDRDNGAAMGALRDRSFQHILARHDALLQCGARTTLGGMLSLMVYEGSGAKVAFYNDRCAENSYDKSATCWTNPKARYSYQFGLAPVHTSNFHPCADPAWTSKMRGLLDAALVASGYSPNSSDIQSVASELRTFCPAASPTRVDFYVLTAHSRFRVPTNGSGNDLANSTGFPFFDPRVVTDLFFAELGPCAGQTSDNAAIGIFGGGDARYRTATVQAQILALFRDFKATSCP